MIRSNLRLMIACAVLAWLSLAAGAVALSNAEAAYQARPTATIVRHKCPGNACPLDEKGCHRDERGNYHCH